MPFKTQTLLYKLSFTQFQLV